MPLGTKVGLMGRKAVVAFFHFGLDQPASAGHMPKQPAIGTHTWEVEEMMQPGPGPEG